MGGGDVRLGESRWPNGSACRGGQRGQMSQSSNSWGIDHCHRHAHQRATPAQPLAHPATILMAPYDYKLRAREQEVLEELVAGKTKKRIAKDRFLSPNTVDTHLRSIYVKLHVNTQAAAVAKAFREGSVK